MSFLSPTLLLRASRSRITPNTLSIPSTLALRHASTMSSATNFFDFKPNDKKGKPYPLSNLKGKVVLVVNTASKCGFTPQFEGLEKLYKGAHPTPSPSYMTIPLISPTELKPNHPDFEILGFPCNQFGGQDPGSDDDIQSFCQLNYGVSFPVLGKTEVNGANPEPVWEWMKNEKPGLMGLQRIKWNFEKFLIGKDGKVVQRWASTSKPEGLKSYIEEELKKGAKPSATSSAKAAAPTKADL